MVTCHNQFSGPRISRSFFTRGAPSLTFSQPRTKTPRRAIVNVDYLDLLLIYATRNHLHPLLGISSFFARFVVGGGRSVKYSELLNNVPNGVLS